jgi:hypothetical protein
LFVFFLKNPPPLLQGLKYGIIWVHYAHPKNLD